MTLATIQLKPLAQKRTRFRYVEAQFGDGYRARRTDGINPVTEVWEVETPPMPKAEAIVFEAELASNGAASFDWQAPDETSASKWVLDPVEWTTNFESSDYASLSFTVSRYHV